MGPLLMYFIPEYHIPQLGHLYNNNNIHIIMNNYRLCHALGTQYGLYPLMNRSHVVGTSEGPHLLCTVMSIID